MTQEELKQTLKDKLKECDKNTLIDIIADVCFMYVRAKAFADMSNANCIQQCINNVQTNLQQVDKVITQRLNINFKKL